MELFCKIKKNHFKTALATIIVFQISCHEDLIRELPVVDRFIPAESLEKSTVQRDGSEISIETLDEGYKSVASDHPEEPAVSGEQQVLTEPVPKKYHKKFAVVCAQIFKWCSKKQKYFPVCNGKRP